MNMRCASTLLRPGRAVPSARRWGRGFTLIELMVAVVVAGILASLAMPAFFDVVRKSRRSEAFASLSAVQQAQERYRADKPAYAPDLAAFSPPLPSRSSSGLYAISITTADAIGYTLQAVAIGSQAKDTSCVTMVLRATAGTVQYGSACSTCTLASPLTDPGRCWSRQ
jgi:type IV pilus assembly protein PilE